MKKIISNARIPVRKTTSLFLILLLLVSSGCEQFLDDLADHFHNHHNNQKFLRGFEQVNLVGSNDEYQPARIDPNLVNAWGIAFGPTGVAWVNSTGKGLSLLYNAEGIPIAARPSVAVPSPTGPTGGLPTGIVFNGTGDFVLTNGQPARFIFVGVDGIISAWNAGTGNQAEKISDESATSAYTGLTLAMDKGANFLYAANFRTGKIDVYDSKFAEVEDKPFTDASLPAGYSPFNIENVGGKLYVLYAKVGPNGRDEPGVGNGIVSVFDTGGGFIRRFITGGRLNAPWGIAYAPAGFFMGKDKGYGDKGGSAPTAILIGNFGDGRIHAYSADGKLLGPLQTHDQPIVIEGLWAIVFPPATATTVDQNRLYFAAGPEEETEGLFGYITK